MKDLKTVDLVSGEVKTLAHVSDWAFGVPNGAWSASNAMVLTTEGLFQLRPGGVLEPRILPDPARGESFIFSPQFLPDGQHYLFSVFRTPGEPLDVGLGDIGEWLRQLSRLRRAA